MIIKSGREDLLSKKMEKNRFRPEVIKPVSSCNKLPVEGVAAASSHEIQVSDQIVMTTISKESSERGVHCFRPVMV